MKRLLWFSRGEKPVIEIVLDVESAQWIADQMDRSDRARVELQQAIDECSPETQSDGGAK